MSLKAALDELGFGPCYHMLEVFNKPRHIELWQAAGEGASIDWDELFAGYHAAVDWPACAFYDQLMQAYPEAKVVLTVRDPETWYESVKNTIYQMSGQPAGASMPVDPSRLAHRRMVNTIVWQGTFGGQFEDKPRALAIFEQHIQDVKNRVPAERLLVYDVKEGWAPLCRFLNVAVPEGKPFPRLNDTSEFQQRAQQRAQSPQN